MLIPGCLIRHLCWQGGGVGSIVPTNLPEYIIFLVGIALGSVLWAMVVGTICGISATGNPFNVAFKHNMDQLNYFLQDMNMPIDLRHRAREYLRNARELGKKHSYNELVDRLSPEVRKDIVLKMSAKTLQVVWYLNGLEEMVLVELAMRLQREGYAPRERLSPDKLTILMRGVAAKAGIILTYQGGQVGKHPFWGEDIILTAQSLRDRKPAAALTYVEVATLTRSDLDLVLSTFPESKRKVGEAAVNIGVRRAMVVVADYIKIQQSRDMTFGGSMKVPDKLKKRMKGGARTSAAGRSSSAEPGDGEPQAPSLKSGAENVLKAAMQQEERAYNISSANAVQGAGGSSSAAHANGGRRMSIGMAGGGPMSSASLTGTGGTPRVDVSSQLMSLVRGQASPGPFILALPLHRLRTAFAPPLQGFCATSFEQSAHPHTLSLWQITEQGRAIDKLTSQMSVIGTNVQQLGSMSA